MLDLSNLSRIAYPQYHATLFIRFLTSQEKIVLVLILAANQGLIDSLINVLISKVF